MKISAFLQGLVAVCIAATASASSGQNAIQLFSPANVRVSTQGTGHGDEAKTFNSTILNLKCASPVQAVLSSSPDGNGNVLIDNFVSLSVNGGYAVDICKHGTTEDGGNEIFADGALAMGNVVLADHGQHEIPEQFGPVADSGRVTFSSASLCCGTISVAVRGDFRGAVGTVASGFSSCGRNSGLAAPMFLGS